jgi:hypothetical protein
MDNMAMGDWMLPGGALILVVLAGIVLVAFDDIVCAILGQRRKNEAPPSESAAKRDTSEKGRGRRLRVHASRLLRPNRRRRVV